MQSQTTCSKRFRLTAAVILALYGGSQLPLAAEDVNPEFIEAEARNDILTSDRWAAAKQQFDRWLSIQTVYSEDEVTAIKSDLLNQVVSMSSAELREFLDQMEARVQILMSPASMDARQWASRFTEKRKREIRKEYGVEDPIRLSADEMAAALQQFAADRQSRRTASSDFQRSRSLQASAAAKRRSTQTAVRSAARARPTPSSAYAPRNVPRTPKTYQRKYPGMSYSVGPWGGVWVSPRSR